MASSKPASVADIESFINLLRAACDDTNVNATLKRLLAMPNEKRRNLVHTWVSDLVINQAPNDFVQAIACLMDDAVAQKAYEVIFKCERGEKT